MRTTMKVQLKERDPVSGQLLVRLVARLEKIQSEWLVVEVGLSDIAGDSPAQPPLRNALVPFARSLQADLENKPPVYRSPYKLVLTEHKKTPVVLMRRSSHREKPSDWKYWALAQPVEELQGNWRIKKVPGTDGRLVSIDTDPITLDGFNGGTGSRKSYIVKHPELADTAIAFTTDDLEKAELIRYSVDGDNLKCDSFDTRVSDQELKVLPPLQPGAGMTYAEWERIPYPLKPIDDQGEESNDSRSQAKPPLRTRHGLLYRDADKKKSSVAVAVSVSGTSGTVVVVDPDPKKAPPNSSVAIRADSVTITQSGGGDLAPSTFALPAIGTDE